MRYYTSGHNMHQASITRTGQYETLEEALLGLHDTSEHYEFAYLCTNKSRDTLAYLYHGMTDKKSRGIKFNFEALAKLVPKK